ncbi:MAG: hypothetical protein HYT11_00385 [Candidatus Levybacteria bacterium]|nr:hypothetical protein [Candidatus Levybacteria bacterium]
MERKKYISFILSFLFAAISIGIIFFINYQIIVSWFGKNGPANIGSIEVSYVSMGKFIVDFGFPLPFLTRHSSWMPFWYFGFPFHIFYTPLLPMLEAFAHILFNIPFWQSYRLLTGIAFIAAPIGVFLLGWQLSRTVIGGLVSGLLYSIGPTLFYFLLPEVASDRFSENFFDPRRFVILARWGEGPHLFSLIFLPIAAFFFARLLKRYRFRTQVLAALFLGLTALSNAIGLFACLLLFVAMAFVDTARRKEAVWKSFFYFVTTGLLSLGMISFWYNLSFLSTFFAEGGGTTKLVLSLFPWGWVGAVLVLGIMYLLTARIIRDFGVMSAFLWFIILFTVVGGYYFSAPHEEAYRRIELLPQALRYMTEVDLSLSLLIGVIIGRMIDYFGRKRRMALYIGNVIGVACVGGIVLYAIPFFPVAQNVTAGEVDLTKTGEYEIAQWLGDHVDQKKVERVFLTGNYGFYLNYFTNIWQHRGGLFQAATHFWPEHIHYQMVNGKDAQIVRAWLVTMNAKYAVIAGSRELYNEMTNKQRFENYEVAYSGGTDTIYAIDLKRPSLAKPVTLSEAASLIPPRKADDKEHLFAYASWVEDSSLNDISFSMVDNDTYHIEGFIDKGEGILVQMTADPGWRALRQAQGKLEKIKTGRDPLGFLMLYPPSGDVDITLIHGPSWKQWLGYGMTLVTLFFIAGFGPYRIIKQSKIPLPS